MKYDAKSLGCGVALGIAVGVALCCLVAVFIFSSYHMGKAGGTASRPVLHSGFCPAEGDTDITGLLKPIRQKYGVPAIAGAVVTSEGTVAEGVVGVRKRGTDIPATLNDKWHLGSDAKAMTAALVARLVEQGQLKWDTTVAGVFPDMTPLFREEMKGLTLLHLLSHRAGLPENLDLSKYSSDDAQGERARAVMHELAKRPLFKAGSKKQYSNLGYVVVGAMIERTTGKSWEKAIQDGLFEPLEMTSCGFGGTGTPGQIDQPWGHQAGGQPVAGNGPSVDNPPVMGPAGRVHCTIQDWARFIRDQLRGSRGEPALLEASSYKTLHTPPFGGDYALGWMVLERSWGGGKVLHHGGCNTMNFANVWVAPERDFAVLVCINQGGDRAFEATDEVVGKLIELHSTWHKERAVRAVASDRENRLDSPSGAE